MPQKSYKGQVVKEKFSHIYSIMLVDEIKKRNQELMKAFANGDSVAAGAIYAPDCYMMPHGRETIHGRLSSNSKGHIPLWDRCGTATAIGQDYIFGTLKLWFHFEFWHCPQESGTVLQAGQYAMHEICITRPRGESLFHDAEGYIKQDMNAGVKHLTLETNEVNGSGDWAYERGTYRLDGNRGGETGNYLIVWKKIQGTWHIYNDCFNVIEGAQG